MDHSMTLGVSPQVKTVLSEAAAVVNLYSNSACVAGPAMRLSIQTCICPPFNNYLYVYHAALVPFRVHVPRC